MLFLFLYFSIHDGQGYGGDLDSCTSSATTETDGEIKQSNYRASFTTFNPAPALQQASSIGVFLMSTLRLDTDTDRSVAFSSILLIVSVGLRRGGIWISTAN